MITHCGLLWHCYVSRKSVGMYKALRAKPELSFRGCPQIQSGEDVTDVGQDRIRCFYDAAV
jgi:hypothetical protein